MRVDWFHGMTSSFITINMGTIVYFESLPHTINQSQILTSAPNVYWSGVKIVTNKFTFHSSFCMLSMLAENYSAQVFYEITIYLADAALYFMVQPIVSLFAWKFLYHFKLNKSLHKVCPKCSNLFLNLNLFSENKCIDTITKRITPCYYLLFVFQPSTLFLHLLFGPPDVSSGSPWF